MKGLVNTILTGTSSAVMIFFAIPKLLGKEQSRAGFAEFENALAIDADLFMVFTGISELIIAALLISFLLNKNVILGKLAFLALLLTMITALGLEFLARQEPKPVLVVIAIILAIFSAYRLKTLTQ